MAKAHKLETSATEAAEFQKSSVRELPWLIDAPKAAWERRFAIGLVLLLALLLLPMIGRVPRAYVDDSWGTMAGYTIAFEGRPRNPGQMGRGGTDSYLLQPRLFANVICAGAYRLAGFGLIQGRLVASIFCCVFVFTVYGLMRRLFGPVAAAAIAVMTAVDPWVFICGRTCREEIFLAALLYLSWWFLLEAIDRRSNWRAFAGGLCIGLACWTHPNAVLFNTAAFIGIIIVVGPRKIAGIWLLAAAGGIVVGLAPYLAYVGYVQSISDVKVMDQVAGRTGAYARSFMEILAIEKIRWENFLRLPLRIPLLLLYIWGATWALLRGKHAERLLLLLIIASILLMPLLVKASHGRYLVVLVPALAALVWRALSISTDHSKEMDNGIGLQCSRIWLRRGVAAILLFVYMAMSLGPTLAVLYAHRKADYDGWVARVGAYIPKNARVMGHTMYWTGLHDRQFISSIPPYYSDWRTVEDAVEHINKYRPEYLIQSSTLFAGVQGTGPREKDLRATVFGRACEQVAVNIPAHVLAEFYERDFGSVRIWRLEWPAKKMTSLQTRD